MKLPPAPHRWNVAPITAVALQRQLAACVMRTPPVGDPLRYVAGLDAAFSRDGTQCIAGVVLWDRGEGRVIEEHTALRKLKFPYVPGLLSFREAPALLAALRCLKQAPDVLMCDGQGLAHPRRFGIACHLGVVTQLPAIGCAKSRLCGTHDQPPAKRGEGVPLRDGDEVIGEVLCTKDGVRPVYVSLGHRMDLPTASHLVLDGAIRHRLPEPTRLADRLVAAEKKRLG